jgi:MHS family proline/betaine transporter-like MFS transporter
MSSTSVTVDTLLRPSSVRAIIAACIGNTLEWYDFIVYTTFAVQISHAFFPAKMLSRHLWRPLSRLG